MIAGKIREIVGKLPVRDSESGQLRPARYQDIVILLRTTSGWDETFKKILEENAIPVFVTSKTGYFAATEVQTVLNFSACAEQSAAGNPTVRRAQIGAVWIQRCAVGDASGVG